MKRGGPPGHPGREFSRAYAECQNKILGDDQRHHR